MDKRRKSLLLKLAAAYWIFAAVIFSVAHQQLEYISVVGEALSAAATTQELTDGHCITQQIVSPADQITKIHIQAVPYAQGEAELRVCVLDGDTLLGTGHRKMSELASGSYDVIALDKPADTSEGQKLTVRIETEGCRPGAGVYIFWGDSVSAGKFDIRRQLAAEDCFSFDGAAGNGMLCVKPEGYRFLHMQGIYWIITVSLFALLAAAVADGLRRERQGRDSAVIGFFNAIIDYRFLVKQLVNRDFKTKYKRSVLGVFWSFLNPLLTMAVQYLVFSTLFKSNTPYFAVYLLTGLVFFGFFSEACSMGMTCITGNAPLIRKVYIPKYIFPVSRVLSSLVNFMFAFIPLFGVMLLSGLPIRMASLLLLYDVLCLTMFVMGMVLILSTMMTFFQDTQFLWGVLSMMWMYLTPIFYPESIIPAGFLTLYHMNPLYQFITFARVCIIDGVSPSPFAYLWCALPAVVLLAAGIIVFRRHQDELVLQL